MSALAISRFEDLAFTRDDIEYLFPSDFQYVVYKMNLRKQESMKRRLDDLCPVNVTIEERFVMYRLDDIKEAFLLT